MWTSRTSRRSTGSTIPVKTPDAWVRAFLERGKAKGLRPSTLAHHGDVLKRFRAFLGGDWSEATEERIEAYLAAESKRPGKLGHLPLVHSTVNGGLSALRCFFRFLVQEKALLMNPARNIHLGKGPQPERRVPSRKDVNRLLAVEGTSPEGLRDRAIVEVLYSTGIRCRELCNLDLQDIDLAGGVVTVRKGKGGKDRRVPIGERAAKAVSEYLRRGRPAMRPRSNALIVNVWGLRLDSTPMALLVKRRSLKAGLTPPVTPHELRHAFATHLLENGASIRHVQAMLGHSAIQSTEIYTHVNAKHLKETLDRANIRASLEREPGQEPEPGLGRFSF